jgi:hypothetical protein
LEEVWKETVLAEFEALGDSEVSEENFEKSYLDIWSLGQN